MFNFLFKRKSKKLDSSLFFSYSVTEDELRKLKAAGHEEFRDTLLKVMEKKLAENVYHLTHGHAKGDEERGVYLGVIRVYEDLIHWFTRTKEKEKKVYKDPYL